MNAEQLRSIQTPLKEKYKADPAAALITLRDGIMGMRTGRAPSPERLLQ